ncbi:MAG: tRNA pseudouridine(55) synthase TruB [Opitutaceae bacterium]|nr:tRNA pseudouridine(55) synthase TruB [Opitutaceae bacterium]
MAEKMDFEGVLLVDKPSGMTSHDVVSRIRRIFKMKRVGHAGTLDPLATGLLILLIGKATKLSQFLMSLDKVYEGTVKLGESTTTQDAEGEVLSTRPVPELSKEDVEAHTAGFIGDQYQIPPMYSAIKIDGVPLYKLARKGKTIEREPRFIRVSAFDVLKYSSPLIDIKVHCSKGTYVRTLVHDLGEKIGCGGHLVALRRTASDNFSIDKAHTLKTLEEASFNDLKDFLIPGHEAAPNHLL